MLRSVRKELKRMDPNLSPDDESYRYALVMLTACQVGPNADKIARRARMPRSEARTLTAACRRTGIFKGTRVAGGHWFKKGGGMDFWLDVCVAQGLMVRTQSSGGGV